MFGSLYAAFLGTRPVEPRPEVKAMKILGPELKKIPGYVPTTDPEVDHCRPGRCLGLTCCSYECSQGRCPSIPTSKEPTP